MTTTILVCASSSGERDHWMRLALDDGAVLEPRTRRARFERLGLELRFEILVRASDAERLRGLELAGVLNLCAVNDQACRSMIYARLRP